MQDRELERIGEGREAEIYAWEPGSVLRLYREPGHHERAEREASVLEAVRASKGRT